MRALVMSTLLVVGCGGSGNPAANMGLVFNGNWTGTLMHPATVCSDGSTKAQYSAATSFSINQDQAGLYLFWTDRCPVAGNIGFAVDSMGTAMQLGDPALCINMPTDQATFSSGTISVAGGVLTLTINEKEDDTGTQPRDCAWLITATMTRQ